MQFNYDFGNTQAVIVTRRGRLFVPIWHFAVYGNCLNIASVSRCVGNFRGANRSKQLQLAIGERMKMEWRCAV